MLEIKVDHGDVHLKALGSQKELICETGTAIHVIAGQLIEAHADPGDKLAVLEMLSAVTKFTVDSVRAEVWK